jgi:hypothetical protein
LADFAKTGYASVDETIISGSSLQKDCGNVMKNTSSKLVAAIAALALASAANASIIVNSTVSFLNTSSPAFPAYDQAFALDTGVNTDYASQGVGNATHLDLDFGSAQTFESIAYTDRVTSGGPNGVFFGGTTDFVTSFRYDFATDAAFSDIVGSVSVSGVVAPVNPTTAAQFLTTTSIPGITARFVRWQVVAANGANPGASNFEFTVGAAATVPEPATLGLLGSALAAIVFLRRKRASARSSIV